MSHSIEKSLARHYIERRSVVFIVDNNFDSATYKYLAHDMVKKLFTKLEDSDYFGFIPIKNFIDDRLEIKLEPCGLNRSAKKHQLRMQNREENFMPSFKKQD